MAFQSLLTGFLILVCCEVSANGGGPYCLTAASDTDGAEVALVACINSNLTDTFPNGNATWTVPVAPLTGTIKTFHNKCLDVPNGSTANGVKLQIWTCAAGNTNQLFTNTRGQIEWAGKGKCIDLTDGKSVNGNPVRISVLSIYSFIPLSPPSLMIRAAC